jgi:hypothetical protein
MTVLIQLTTAGADTGPFNLYSNIDGFGIPFEVGVTKVDLLAGYLSSLVPDLTTTIKVCSTSLYCSNCIDIIISPYCDNCTCYTITSTPGVEVSYFDCDGVAQSFEYVDVVQICAQNGTVSFDGEGTAVSSGCCEATESGYVCPTTTTTSSSSTSTSTTTSTTTIP